jgi:eukaryotic-like serine/threonine-protein kinase
VLSPLAAGGMGEVYVAEQLSTGKRRALKIMHGGLVADAAQRTRFVHEARVGSAIASDHVVEVIGAGVDEATGLPWLAMELLDGEDLAAHVTRLGALAPEEVRRLFRQLCHAVGAAHTAGIVHRDLKPQNVFLAKARTLDAPTVVKVLDFGIAKLLASSPTVNTGLVGSPAWMAPEQTDPRASATPATDVWALGLLAFWMLAGRAFWLSANDAESSLQVIMRECLIEPIPPASQRAAELGLASRLPSGFDAWFARCVDREPQARFTSVGELLTMLERVLDAPGPTLLAEPAAAAVPGAGGSSSADIAALSTQRFLEPAPLPAARLPIPQPAALVATTMSPHGLATRAPLEGRRRGRRWLWAIGAAGLLLAGGAIGGVSYWLGEQGSGGARSAKRASRERSSAAPSARPAPPPAAGPVVVGPASASGGRMPDLLDASRHVPLAQAAAKQVAAEPVLVTLAATGVTEAGLVDLRNPNNQAVFIYRSASDGRCVFVNVSQNGQRVWALQAGQCPGPAVGPPRCNLGEVIRKARTGMSATDRPSVTLKYGGDLQGKPTWSASWGDAINVGGVADDCAAGGG